MEVYKLKQPAEEDSVGRCETSMRYHDAARTAPGVRELPRVLNVEESTDHLKWTHLEHAQHCTDLPLQVTLPALTEQGKMGPRLE